MSRVIRFTKAAAKPKKPKKTGGKKAALNKLNSFLKQTEPETVEILVNNLHAQGNSVTYKELREAYMAGGMTEKQFKNWQKKYGNLVKTALQPKWEQAAALAAAEVKAKYPYYVYEPSVSAAMDYIKQHGAELVTNLALEQKDALNAVIRHVSGYTAITPDEAARIIRPCIGLTKPQALANARYRESVKQAYLKAHPNGKPETAEKKAREASARYAVRQHRYRAQCIARTELAFGYNAGAYGATKDAQANGYIGECKKVWVTAYDERVCPICSAMDDEKKDMDEPFSNGILLPPGHPQCRCAVAYEEIADNRLTTEPSGGKMKENDVNNLRDNVLPENLLEQRPRQMAKDVTDEYLQAATPQIGTITRDEGYNEKIHKNEIDFADWLYNCFGGGIKLLKEIKTEGVRTPDYIWNGKYWELKTVSTEKSANSAIRKGLHQIKANPGGLFLDFGDKGIFIDTLLDVIEERMQWHKGESLDIMIIQKGELIKVLRYGKRA